MAEGLLEGVLGGEEEKIDPTVSGAEPLAAAIATQLAGQSPEVAAATVAFLQQQTNVLRRQEKNLDAEYEVFESEAGPRLLALRLRTGFQLFFAVIATVIGLALAIIVWSATRSRSVVIDAFDIAPNIATEVPSGKIVAAGLLDVLTKIQAASRTPIEHRNLTNAWTSEISVEVPETGISLNELERMVKTRFGHDQHIEGDLIRSGSGGLALTVRGNGIQPQTFSGEASGLDKLLTQAGEYLFSQSQPGLWVAYLTSVDRDKEAVAFAQAAYNTVEPGERPYVLNGWANALVDLAGEGAMAQALPLFREALRLKPDYWVGYNNVMFALGSLGDEEGVVRTGAQMMKTAGGRPGHAPEDMYENFDELVWDLQAERASNIADMESHGGIGSVSSGSGLENLTVAKLEVQMHHPEAGALRVKTTPVDAKNPADVASAAMVRALLAEEAGNLDEAAREWDAYTTAYSHSVVSTGNPQWICFTAVTYQKTNQPAKADAALKPDGGKPYVDCYRFKGDVLDLRGDWAGAQQWYANTVALAPSLPAGHYSWGVALARHGDLAAAAAQLQLANQKGPHWADPLKAWGDVLVQQGSIKEALAKYDEALKYAPTWKELKEARQAAAKSKS